MYRFRFFLATVSLLLFTFSCKENKNASTASLETNKSMTAKDILGNPDYQAISYGGYREKSRDYQPSIAELKEDMSILFAMGIRIVRTYNVQLPHAVNLLKAISELKAENSDFEMYVMLGAWIDCKDAWTLKPDHNLESEQNSGEIERAIKLVNQYPDIVKILAVGNEAMVKWATSYYVQPAVILKWVNHLQALKSKGALPKDLWVTSSDDYSSWGGGSEDYHTKDLAALVKAVDYVSLHTYPFHNTHYNPEFWKESEDIKQNKIKSITAAMARARAFAQSQYDSVKSYVHSIDLNKPMHIGETGWSTVSNGFYSDNGSRAADEYKEGLYYKAMMEWTKANNISCFYFEAFDEQWKDAENNDGSENHFGLFTVDGQAKYALWSLVDNSTFKGLSRNGNAIRKTFNGNVDSLLIHVKKPPIKNLEVK